MTYKEVENMFGENSDGTPDGIARGSIARGIRDLMAKGFIEIVRQGGAYQKDKTIYGLTDDWQLWRKGSVVREKQSGKRSGYHALQNNLNHQSDTHTHHQSDTLNP